MATESGVTIDAAVDDGGARVKRRRSLSEIGRDIRKRPLLYLMLVPVLIYYLAFQYLPLFGVAIAFQDYNIFDGFRGSEWVGFQWFRILFDDPNFLTLILNTLKFSLLRLILQFPIPIFFALFLNELRTGSYKKAIQTVTYLPHFFSWAICGAIVISFLSFSGPINSLRQSLGHEPIPFLLRISTFTPVYVISGIWKDFGWGSIIYLAAISGVNPELYEAAYMDGATRLQRALHITVPSIRHIIVITLILRCGDMLGVGFDQMYILAPDMLRSSTDILSTYIFRVGIRGGAYSYTAAIGLFRSIVDVTLIVITNRIAKSLGESGVW